MEVKSKIWVQQPGFLLPKKEEFADIPVDGYGPQDFEFLFAADLIQEFQFVKDFMPILAVESQIERKSQHFSNKSPNLS